MVLALAMLLPATSSAVWLARMPLIPAKSERSMVVSFRDGLVQTWVVRTWWSGPDGSGAGWGRRVGSVAVGHGHDIGDRHLDALDVEHGTGVPELDAMDQAGALGAVAECVGHGPADQTAGAEGHLGPQHQTGLVRDGLHLLQGGELGRLGEEL